MEALFKRLDSTKIENIVLLVGPGISEASGVPDISSPDYINSLIKSPNELGPYEADTIFDIEVFQKDPRPFWWAFSKTLPIYTSSYPTSFHFLIKLLANNDKLLKCYTQNIDGLESAAGIPSHLIMNSKGQYNTCHCINCRKEISLKNCIKQLTANLANKDLTIETTKYPVCEFCGSKCVKPDVVFLHENLPNDFFAEYPYDFDDADLLIIAGTQLEYEPFSSLPSKIDASVSRFFVGKKKPRKSVNLNFATKRDFFIKSDCEEFATELCQLFGWDSALKVMIADRKMLGFRWFGFDSKKSKRRIPQRELDEINDFYLEVQINMPDTNRAQKDQDNNNDDDDDDIIKQQAPMQIQDVNETISFNQLQVPIMNPIQIQYENSNNNNNNGNLNIPQQQFEPQQFSIIERPGIVFRT